MPRTSALWQDILTSSIWSETHATRIVWITMLASADEEGIVHASVGGLAHLARVPHAECQLALDVLKKPDDDSRTKDKEGRRIEDVDGGWRIINWKKYQLALAPKRPSEKRRAYMRDYQKTRRAEERKEDREDLKLDSGEIIKKNDRTPTSVEAMFVADLFRRRHSTPWSAKEIRVFRDAVNRGVLTAENREFLQRYYDAERAKAGNGIHRRDLATFLNNIDGEIDRARSNCAAVTPRSNNGNSASNPIPTAASAANSGTSNAAHAKKY